jgi:hypothetical protein
MRSSDQRIDSGNLSITTQTPSRVGNAATQIPRFGEIAKKNPMHTRRLDNRQAARKN